MNSEVMKQLFVPVLLFGGCLYIAFKLVKFHDYSLTLGRGKKLRKKDVEPYCREAAALMAAFGAASLIMGVISLFNSTFALVFIIVIFIATAFCWKKLADRYPAQEDKKK